MVETIIAVLFVLIAFFSVFQFADNLRTKLLLQHAAARVARAKPVGFNDYMLVKTARVATIPVSGKCLSSSEEGGTLGIGEIVERCPSYLASEHEGFARPLLDYEYWHDRLHIECSQNGNRFVARVLQERPQFFDLARFLSGEEKSYSDEQDEESVMRLHGEASIEAHAPDWMN